MILETKQNVRFCFSRVRNYFRVKIDNTPEITPFATLTNLMMKNKRYQPNKKVPQGHNFTKFF